MSITVLNSIGDSVWGTAENTNSVTIGTYNPAGSNLKCLVFACSADNSVAVPNSCTRNSVSGTNFHGDTHQTYYAHGGWYFDGSDASGNHSISVGWPSNDAVLAGCAVYLSDATAGALQDEQHTSATSGTSHSDTVGSTANSMCIDAIWYGDSITSTVGSGQTNRCDTGHFGPFDEEMNASTEAGTGSAVTMSWTSSASAAIWTSLSVCVTEDVAAAGENAKPLVQRTRLQPLVGGGLHQ